MDIFEIGKLIRTSQYDFLRNDERLKNTILLTLGGSHAYGTNIEGSDIDIRGIALNSADEILLGKDFGSVVHNETDTTIYSFNKIISLLTNCNPNTIEMLGCKHYFYLSDIGEQLLDNRHMFLSKKAAASFGGYANSVLWKLKHLSDYEVTHEEIDEQIIKSINHASIGFKEHYFEVPDDSIKLYIDGAVNPEWDSEIFMDVNLHHYPLRDYKGMWSEMNNIVKEYNNIGSRNKKAAEHGKLTKHAMHLVRLYFMCFDILEREEIVTYRDENDFLLKIRNGMFFDGNKPKQELFDYVNELQERLEYDIKNTSLPDKPDYKTIAEFQAETNKKIIMGEI